jgi:ribosomal-protein-alanine N-acetyltransferase
MGDWQRPSGAGKPSTAGRYRVREATSSDLPGILAIEREVFSDPWPVSGFQAFLGELGLVSEFDGEVVGYIFARVAGGEAEILNLAVHRAHRSRGVGRSLLEEIVKRVARRGANLLFLEVRVSNVEAQNFYCKMGFKQVGRRPNYYVRPREDALILARELWGKTG